MEDCFQTRIVAPKVLNKQSRTVVKKEVVMSLNAGGGLAIRDLE